MLPFRLIALALMTLAVAACKPDAADPGTPAAAAAARSTDAAAPATAASVAGASTATVATAASTATSLAGAAPSTTTAASPAPSATTAATSAPSATAAPTAAAASTAAPALPPVAGAVPAAASGEFRIVSVVLGNAVDADNLVVSELGSFGHKDAIYASVLSTGRSQGLRISARWMAPDGSTIAETSQPLVPTTTTVTTFSVRNPKGWPDGEYQLLIGINGHAQLKKSFTVRR